MRSGSEFLLIWLALGALLGTIWHPDASQKAPKTPEVTPKFPKECPRSPKDYPRCAKSSPKSAQEATKSPQEAPKRPQRSPKRAPRGPQEAPKTPRRGPKEPPRDPQDAPKPPEEVPKTFAERISRYGKVPKVRKMLSKKNREGSSCSQPSRFGSFWSGLACAVVRDGGFFWGHWRSLFTRTLSLCTLSFSLFSLPFCVFTRRSRNRRGLLPP